MCIEWVVRWKEEFDRIKEILGSDPTVCREISRSSREGCLAGVYKEVCDGVQNLKLKRKLPDKKACIGTQSQLLKTWQLGR